MKLSYILPQKLIPEITFDSTWGDLIARVKNHPNLIFKVQVEMKKNDWMYQTFKQSLRFLLAVHHHCTVLHKWHHAIEWLAIKKKLNKIRTCVPNRAAFSNCICSVNLSLVGLLLFSLFWLGPKVIRNRRCQSGQS